MRTVKILNLYGEALGLNGEERAITAVCQRLAEMGYEAEVSEQGIGDDLSLDGFDLVFMTHGKPQNVSALAAHFCRYKEKIIAYIESGRPMVVTGSANMLLEKRFTMLDGKTYEGIGLLDCVSEEFDSLYVSDAVLSPDFAPKEKCFGCFYRCETVTYEKPEERPLFRALKADPGEGCVSDREGVHYKNLFATWCLGPVLVRNPLMMKEVLKATLGADYRETDFSLEERALRQILKDMGQ